MVRNICETCKKIFNNKVTRRFCSVRCYLKSDRKVNNQGFDKNHTWLDIITKKELNELYNEKYYSINKIAKLKKCNFNVIRRRLKFFNLKRRTAKEQGKLESKLGRTKKSHEKYIIKGSKVRNRKNYLKIAKDNYEWKCMVCSKNNTNKRFDLVVHHKDFNNKNNDINNLMLLCQN